MILARCFVLGGFTLFFLGFAGSREANRVLKNKGQDLHSGVERYVPSQQRLAGPQILLVFLGSSTCMYSNDPDLPGAVEALKPELQGCRRGSGLGGGKRGTPPEFVRTV
jgi:hypothetical protein